MTFCAPKPETVPVNVPARPDFRAVKYQRSRRAGECHRFGIGGNEFERRACPNGRRS